MLVQITLEAVNDGLRLRRLDLRKGFAFPKEVGHEPPSPRRLEGSAFQPARRRTSSGRIGRKARGFPQVGAAEPR
jgi:hypothetical protein